MRKRFEHEVISLLAILLVFSFSALAQQYAPLFPRAGAVKTAEGDRFTVWKVSWEKGKSTGMHKLALDQVSVFLGEGAIKFTRPDGTYSIEEERFGSVRFDPKGTIVAEEGLSDEPPQATVFQLTDAVLTPWPIMLGIPGQEPRPGSVKLFENDRISVWDHTWRAGAPVKAHLHYLRAAGVFLEAGSLRTVSNGVPAGPFAKKQGDVVMVDAPLPAPHEEYEAEGTPRAIIIQVKNQ